MCRQNVRKYDMSVTRIETSYITVGFLFSTGCRPEVSRALVNDARYWTCP